MQIHRPVPLLFVALTITLASCTSGATERTSTSPTQTTTTTTTTTTTIVPQATPSSTLAAGLDASVVEARTAELDELIAEVQTVRGLPFLVPLRVAVETREGVVARIEDELSQVSRDFVLEQRFLELIGLLGSATDLERVYQREYVASVPAFYDTTTAELVVDGERMEWSPYDRSVVMHELIHALTDQHFRHGATARMLHEAGNRDAGTAFTALVEGDATYFQLVYLQDLGPEAQLAAAEAAAQANERRSPATPDFIEADLAFPFDRGTLFVERLVAGGGIAAVDRAYGDPPATTEQILHPERYQALEASRSVDAQVDVTIEGYEAEPTSSLGEWFLTLLLTDTLSPGDLAQTVDGWRGDALRLFDNGTELALAYVYVGESEDDAIELTQALLAYARDQLQLGEGYEAAGGVQFDEGGAFVFIDRIGDGLRMVMADDPAAGEALRQTVRVP